MRQAAPRDDERPVDVVDVVPVGGGRPGDLDAEFTEFMAEHADTLLHTAWLLVGNMDRAEELTQQALVRTYGAWRRARTDPLPYARRVLVNLRVDTWRRHRREVLTDEVPEACADARGHARAEDRDQLVRALALLTPRQRRVVVLRYLADVSEPTSPPTSVSRPGRSRRRPHAASRRSGPRCGRPTSPREVPDDRRRRRRAATPRPFPVPGAWRPARPCARRARRAPTRTGAPRRGDDGRLRARGRACVRPATARRPHGPPDPADHDARTVVDARGERDAEPLALVGGLPGHRHDDAHPALRPSRHGPARHASDCRRRGWRPRLDHRTRRRNGAAGCSDSDGVRPPERRLPVLPVRVRALDARGEHRLDRRTAERAEARPDDDLAVSGDWIVWFESDFANSYEAPYVLWARPRSGGQAHEIARSAQSPDKDWPYAVYEHHPVIAGETLFWYDEVYEGAATVAVVMSAPLDGSRPATVLVRNARSLDPDRCSDDAALFVVTGTDIHSRQALHRIALGPDGSARSDRIVDGDLLGTGEDITDVTACGDTVVVAHDIDREKVERGSWLEIRQAGATTRSIVWPEGTGKSIGDLVPGPGFVTWWAYNGAYPDRAYLYDVSDQTLHEFPSQYSVTTDGTFMWWYQPVPSSNIGRQAAARINGP